MFSSLRIEGYRGLKEFTMKDLGRVNLLVGSNNSGKTSVLEAISLLASAGDSNFLRRTLWSRGEGFPTSGDTLELDVAHLFTGHEIRPGSTLRISATNGKLSRDLQFLIGEGSPTGLVAIGGPSHLQMELKGTPKPQVDTMGLTSSGGLLLYARNVPNKRKHQDMNEALPALFITTESFTGEELVGMWNQVVLTPDEDLVLKALQFLDPDIERIAAYGTTHSSSTRNGFIVKRKGSTQPIPIGSMGDGMWRMLALAIAITQCRGGVLLVDEIDTGLHYTAMSRMWKLVYQAAVNMDVQVFATTHSADCFQSLAEVSAEVASPGAITIQRIESGRPRAVHYNSNELAAIASSDIEVR